MVYAVAAIAADLVLYKDPTKSGIVLAAGCVWFFFLFALGYSSIAVVSFLALIHLLARFVYRHATGYAAAFGLMKERPIAPAPETFVKEEEVAAYAADVTRLINATLHAAYALMVCESTPVACAWMGGLYGVYFLASRLSTTLFLALCWVAAFTLPVAYTKKQKEVDALVAAARAKASELIAKIPKASTLEAAKKAAADGTKKEEAKKDE